MKYTLTMVCFALFFSAVGYTARIVVEVAGTEETAAATGVEAEDAGPYLSTVDHLAERLELSADQRTRLASMIESTAKQLSRCDRDRREVIRESRHAVYELLTPVQHERLESYVDGYWTRYRDRRLHAAQQTCREHLGLCELETARVSAAFRRYEEAKGEWWRAQRDRDDLPNRESWSLFETEQRRAFESSMDGVLTADQLEVLWREVDGVDHECEGSESADGRTDAASECGDGDARPVETPEPRT